MYLPSLICIFAYHVPKLLEWLLNDLSFLRGPGLRSAGVNFHFFIASDRGECQLTGTFFRMEKYCF